MTTIRKGQAPAPLDRNTFRLQFHRAFSDPAFESVHDALAQVEEVAWQNYHAGRKAPRTRPAGPGYADPAYDLSDEWRAASERLQQAQRVQQDPATTPRVLLINGAARNDGSCPGEMSKSWRMVQWLHETLGADGFDVRTLDLSWLTSGYDMHIYPCKGCLSTAMPLCHWPCSCYPNHGNGQAKDWMPEIYEEWVAAHGVIIVTPVYWYQAPSPLKLMIDRLVCADGGNPDPTTTHGKHAEEAKALELAGWPYPKHLAGRAYGLVVHGDVAGTESLRRNLSDWLDWMGLIPSGGQAQLDRFIGYYQPYAESHDVLDRDRALQEEVRNVARAVAATIRRLRAGTFHEGDEGLTPPRPK
ncbi:flavodoxin family protein [Pseudoduganella ginsengisoli]|uniref:NADPH-dependent FMN reductase n=1 Tax=Pseudoduganella ginsengisoli TaxID=1462440 RepID=A0A6L6Q6Y2_9BURK|nr:NAD(P)H-dependent oxidoreductase [Pseudoduganella ginsengisoli]MTW05276.1 NADPH-dependent FMN reductase [Pseudoduganella ginsengisoli]